MIAGRMKYRITLLQPVVERSATGSEDVQYIQYGSVWAERVRQSASRREELGEHFADYQAVFNIRDAHPVDEDWRVDYRGDLYTVVSIIPNLDRGYNTLNCEKLNL